MLHRRLHVLPVQQLAFLAAPGRARDGMHQPAAFDVHQAERVFDPVLFVQVPLEGFDVPGVLVDPLALKDKILQLHRGVLVRDPRLEAVGHQEVDQEQHDRYHRQPALEMNRQRGLLVSCAQADRFFPAQFQNHRGAQRQADRREQDHRDRRGLHHFIGHRHIVPVGEQHRIHVEYFHHRAEEEGLRHRGTFSLVGLFVQQRRQQARQARAHPAGKLRKLPDAPQLAGQDPFRPADHAGDHAAQRAEEQARRQGADIAHVQDQHSVVDADMVCRDGAGAVDQADQDLHARPDLLLFPAQHPQPCRNQHIHQGRRRHLQDHLKHRVTAPSSGIPRYRILPSRQPLPAFLRQRLFRRRLRPPVPGRSPGPPP